MFEHRYNAERKGQTIRVDIDVETTFSDLKRDDYSDDGCDNGAMRVWISKMAEAGDMDLFTQRPFRG